MVVGQCNAIKVLSEWHGLLDRLYMLAKANDFLYLADES